MDAEIKARFEGKVSKAVSCWLWAAGIDAHGYGAFSVNRRMKKAHRIAYELYVGPIPAGEYVLHKCDNRRCVNPAHLFLGTHADNMQDMADKRRGAEGQRNAMAKLTRRHVAQIRALRKKGWVQTRIAAKFGVTQTAISKICLGARWRT